MNLVVCFASAGGVSPDFHFRPKPPFVPDRQIFDSPPVNRQPEAPPAQPRPRKVSAALKAYAKLVMSADKGAVRDLSLLD